MPNIKNYFVINIIKDLQFSYTFLILKILELIEYFVDPLSLSTTLYRKNNTPTSNTHTYIFFS